MRVYFTLLEIIAYAASVCIYHDELLQWIIQHQHDWHYITVFALIIPLILDMLIGRMLERMDAMKETQKKTKVWKNKIRR